MIYNILYIILRFALHRTDAHTRTHARIKHNKVTYFAFEKQIFRPKSAKRVGVTKLNLPIPSYKEVKRG